MSPDAPASTAQSRPQERLYDSLSSYQHLLTEGAVEDIRAQAQELRESLGLEHGSERAVHDQYQERNPFEKLVRQRLRTREEADAWCQAHREEVHLFVAVEEELISRAQARYRAATEREVVRREGLHHIDRIGEVAGARGDEYAARVERRATVLASSLEGASEQRVREVVGAAKAEIKASGGLKGAPFEAIAWRVAAQMHHNADNDRFYEGHRAARELSRSQTESSAPAADVAIDM